MLESAIAAVAIAFVLVVVDLYLTGQKNSAECTFRWVDLSSVKALLWHCLKSQRFTQLIGSTQVPTACTIEDQKEQCDKEHQKAQPVQENDDDASFAQLIDDNTE